jgi:FKBP-type peptidyl-prolyl cis-trans isomerase FklB
MSKSKFLILALAIVPQVVFSQKDNTPKMKNELDSVSYCLGIAIGQTFKSTGINTYNESLFLKAISDVLRNKTLPFTQQQTNDVLQAYITKKRDEISKVNLEQGKKFLIENSKKEGVVTLPSGLQYKIIKDGEGQSPTINDQVTCNYKGTFIDGSVFDSSYDRGEPAHFSVNGVIKGWTEALQLMKPGSKWILYVPSELAYGDQNIPGINPNSVLIFEVELLSIDKQQDNNTNNSEE